MKNKFIDIFEEETYIENDERINEIYNKIYKEQYNIIYLFLSIWYLYELMILQKNDTPLILFIVLDGIYIDIRLAMKKAYIKTSLKYITSFAWVLLLLRYFKYKFLININLIIIAIISFIICYLYLKLILYINNKSKI
ncbi:hypothetical protein [Clostridium sporogenes]|uniref:hypothetical protein n=1 Tax=Clostridium sporogenes TaxID=1509 RepID=UPI00024BA389|nr:hypothetical protein [Clostridium sporogenes]EHN15625.1 hypothetical protein IYC_07730 [Clostridium sporogenes PA 3679]MCW6108681.1 hypothetical protein [Clostridium sporogenes]